MSMITESKKRQTDRSTHIQSSRQTRQINRHTDRQTNSRSIGWKRLHMFLDQSSSSCRMINQNSCNTARDWLLYCPYSKTANHNSTTITEFENESARL